MRESIEECTGEKGMAYEDDNDWCYGWMKLPLDHPNCTRMKGYKYIRVALTKAIIEKSRGGRFLWNRI